MMICSKAIANQQSQGGSTKLQHFQVMAVSYMRREWGDLLSHTPHHLRLRVEVAASYLNPG